MLNIHQCSLLSASTTTEPQLFDLRITRFIENPDSGPCMCALSSNVELNPEHRLQRLRKSVDEYDSLFPTAASPDHSTITKAPSVKDFEGEKTKEAMTARHSTPSQDKVELQRAAEKFKARIAVLSADDEQPLGEDDFATLHFEAILPYLKVALKQRVGPGISIGVFETIDCRVIQIMTHQELPHMGQLEMAEMVAELLPEASRHSTTLSFTQGRLIRSAREMNGIELCKPRNAYKYNALEMGDSIGSDRSDGVSTSGPRILLGKRVYRVNCWHMWEDFDGHNDSIDGDVQPDVYHPSYPNVTECNHIGSLAVAEGPQRTGKVVLRSGFDRTTTRISSHPDFMGWGHGSWSIVSDWTLSTEENQLPKPNIVRMTGVPQVGTDNLITSAGLIRPGSYVYSLGRSSGLQIGSVRRFPTFMDGEMNGTGKDTHEWTVEQALTELGKEAWRCGGLGIPGDSGAAVIDLQTHALVGQVWATAIDDTGDRVTYISNWSDIADHIKEKNRGGLTLVLPKQDDHWYKETSRPVCDGCADELKEHLDSIEPILRLVDQRPTGKPCSNDSSLTLSGQDTPLSESLTQDDSGESEVGKDSKISQRPLHQALDKKTQLKAKVAMSAGPAHINIPNIGQTLHRSSMRETERASIVLPAAEQAVVA